MVAVVICTDAAARYRYLTGPIAALAGVTHVETAPVIRQIKQLASDPLG